MKNGALLHQYIAQGIYQRAGKVDGKTSWISSSNTLWFDALSGDWMIGLLNNLGAILYTILYTKGAQGRSSCPYTVPNDAWMYWNDGSWIIADANDVSIECLKGNHSFW